MTPSGNREFADAFQRSLFPVGAVRYGRPLPGTDAEPWWYGYSVGHWDGDTLVVDTTGFKDGGWLDVIGNPMTDAAKWTERFRRPT